MRCYFHGSKFVIQMKSFQKVPSGQRILFQETMNFTWSIVIRNEKVVWKHGPNRPFYVFILRTKLYQNPFFSIVHQNVNKPKIRAARTVNGPIFSPFYVIIIRFFFFFLPKSKYNRIKLCYNRLQFVKKTQRSTVSNIDRRAKLHRS